jgi:hypothetical protein
VTKLLSGEFRVMTDLLKSRNYGSGIIEEDTLWI